MDNVGRIIKDFYCNGFFGREYDFSGATIVGEGEDWMVIRKEDGKIAFADFQAYRKVPGAIILVPRTDKQEFIDSWCEEK